MRRSTSKKEIRLVVGGESRVDLLPPEVAGRAKAKSTRRVLIGSVVLVAVIVAGGYFFSVYNAATSALQLAEAQERTTQLIQQQGEFIEIRQVQSDLLGAQAGKVVGSSTEIDWESYFGSLRGSLPEGVDFSGLLVESSTPIEAVGAAITANPLGGASVVTLTLEVASPQVIDVKSWLISLESVPGFVDAAPKTVTRQDDGSYSASVMMHVDQNAYWNRFAPADEESPASADSVADTTEGGN